MEQQIKQISCKLCSRSYKHSCEYELGDEHCHEAFEDASVEQLYTGMLLDAGSLYEEDDDRELITEALTMRSVDACMMYRWLYTHELCVQCDGSGTVIGAKSLQTCNTCHGTGVLTVEHNISKFYFAYTVLSENGIILNPSITPIVDSIDMSKRRVIINHNIVMENIVTKKGNCIQYTRLGEIMVSAKIPHLENPVSDTLICTNTDGEIEFIGTYAGLTEYLGMHLWEDLSDALTKRGIRVFLENRFNADHVIVDRTRVVEMYNALLLKDASRYIQRYVYEDRDYRVLLLLNYVDRVHGLIAEDCINFLSEEGMYQLAISERNLYYKSRRDFIRYGVPEVSSNLAGRMLYDITAMLADESGDTKEIELRMLNGTNIVAMFVVECLTVAKSEELEQL